jgi:hypothetical protein
MAAVPALAVPQGNPVYTKIYKTLDVNATPRFPTQKGLHVEYDELLKKKQEMLRRQKDLAVRINGRLVGEKNGVGLNEVARRTCKNLNAAVAAAKRPGYFDYYKPPEEIQQQVAKQELQTMLRKLEVMDVGLKELDDSLDEELAKKKASLEARSVPEVKSLKEWFASYGAPQRPEGQGPGWRTELAPSKYIYGGTAHHRGERAPCPHCATTSVLIVSVLLCRSLQNPSEDPEGGQADTISQPSGSSPWFCRNPLQ